MTEHLRPRTLSSPSTGSEQKPYRIDTTVLRKVPTEPVFLYCPRCFMPIALAYKIEGNWMYPCRVCGNAKVL